MKRLILLILIPYSIALTGCGQSGALYYPKAPLPSPHKEHAPTLMKEPTLENQPHQPPEKPSDHEKPQ